MNNREAAQHLGVSDSTISRLVANERKPSINLLIKIHERLGWGIENQVKLLGGHVPGTTYGRILQLLIKVTPVGFKPMPRAVCQQCIDSRATGRVE